MSAKHIKTILNQITESLFNPKTTSDHEMHHYLMTILSAVNVIVLTATFFVPQSI